MSTITYILLWPLLGAICVAALPGSFRFAIRSIALVTTFLSMILAILLFIGFDASVVGPQFV